MRLTSLCGLVVLVSIVGAIYIPHPKNQNLMVPVILDDSRPAVRLEHYQVEDAPNPNRLYEFLALIFATPILLWALNPKSDTDGNTDGANGGGNGFSVVTGSPCCG